MISFRSHPLLAVIVILVLIASFVAAAVIVSNTLGRQNYVNPTSLALSHVSVDSRFYGCVENYQDWTDTGILECNKTYDDGLRIQNSNLTRTVTVTIYVKIYKTTDTQDQIDWSNVIMRAYCPTDHQWETIVFTDYGDYLQGSLFNLNHNPATVVVPAGADDHIGLLICYYEGGCTYAVDIWAEEA